LNEEADDDDDVTGDQEGEKELYRLSDASGKLNFRLEKKGDVSQGDLDTKVCLICQIVVYMKVVVKQKCYPTVL